eukprot:6131244-Prymnesium_polylepis.1
MGSSSPFSLDGVVGDWRTGEGLGGGEAGNWVSSTGLGAAGSSGGGEAGRSVASGGSAGTFAAPVHVWALDAISVLGAEGCGAAAEPSHCSRSLRFTSSQTSVPEPVARQIQLATTMLALAE